MDQETFIARVEDALNKFVPSGEVDCAVGHDVRVVKHDHGEFLILFPDGAWTVPRVEAIHGCAMGKWRTFVRDYIRALAVLGTISQEDADAYLAHWAQEDRKIRKMRDVERLRLSADRLGYRLELAQ